MREYLKAVSAPIFSYMIEERSTVIPAVYLVLTENNRILPSRRYNTGFQDGRYSLPAGHLDGREETLMQAMVRETREEIGVKIEPENLELIHVMHRKQTEPTDERRINLFFRASKWEGEPRIMEPDRCDDLRWVNPNRLPRNTISYVKQAIECVRNRLFYSEYGFSNEH
jgi:8-oxo-dGTP pyrophosphatase MutT (NUDIX family)